MRRGQLVLILALLMGLGLAGALVGSSSAQSRCTVQLRVNVFGPSSPQSHWALQGGLNAGSLATLRAVARGCKLDHITGRWRSGLTGAFPRSPHMCSGRICEWGVRSDVQSAADFQAYARTHTRDRSNIVRVAWAGGLSGTYNTFDGAGNPTGTADIQMSGTDVTATNERSETATGTYNPNTRTITMTEGGWPDATPATPLTGRVSTAGGKLRIDWGPRPTAGGAPGGFWIHQ